MEAATGLHKGIQWHTDVEIDYHCICFVKPDHDSHLYAFNSDQRGSADICSLKRCDDVLGGCGLGAIEHFIAVNGEGVGRFGMMALVSGLLFESYFVAYILNTTFSVKDHGLSSSGAID